MSNVGLRRGDAFTATVFGEDLHHRRDRRPKMVEVGASPTARIGHMMGYGRYRDDYMHMDVTSEEWKNYIKIREQTLRVYSKYGLDISKKQLELDAELLKEEPDWERVQKINDEIALLESQVKTEMLKRRYEGFKDQ